MEPGTKELVLVITTDPRKDTERCSMAFSIANSALACEIPVKVFCAQDGVKMLKKGYLEGLVTDHFAGLEEMVNLYREEGGGLYACRPFLLTRGLSEDDLIEGVQIAAAPTLVLSLTGATVMTL